MEVVSLAKKRSSSKSKSSSFEDEVISLTALPTLPTEQMRRVAQHHPEFISLLDDYTSKVKELRSDVQPLLNRLREFESTAGFSSNLELTEGISFLQLKFQTILSYVSNILFYLLLKTEGKSVEDHPVINRLVEMRVVLEKIRPVDKQLKYQIEKLLKAGAMAGTGADVEDAMEMSLEGEEKDLLSFKPNLAGMAGGEMKKVGSADGEDSDDEEHDERPARSMGLHGGLSTTAFEMEERRLARTNARDQKLRNKTSTSKLVEEMRRELSERPEEENTYGMAGFKVANIDKEREAFEEEHYMRLMETKDSRRRRKNAEKIGTFDEFDDFADLSQLAHMEDDNRKTKKAKTDANHGDAFASLRNRAPSSFDASDESDVQNERAYQRPQAFDNSKRRRGGSNSRGGSRGGSSSRGGGRGRGSSRGRGSNRGRN